MFEQRGTKGWGIAGVAVSMIMEGGSNVEVEVKVKIEDEDEDER